MKRRAVQNGIQIWERCYCSTPFTNHNYWDHHYTLVSTVEQTIRDKTFYRILILLDQYTSYTNLFLWFIRRWLSAIASHWIFIDYIISIKPREVPPVKNEGESSRAFHSNIPANSSICWIATIDGGGGITSSNSMTNMKYPNKKRRMPSSIKERSHTSLVGRMCKLS